MSDLRHETILRVGNLSPEAAEQLIKTLKPLAAALSHSGGGRIERDHTGGAVMHVGRKKHL